MANSTMQSIRQNKNSIALGVLATIATLITACSKTGDPNVAPVTPPVVNPPVVVVPTAPIYEYGITTGNTTSLDASNNVVRSVWKIAGGGAIDFGPTGNIQGKVFNLDKGTITETMSSGVPSEQPSNISIGLSTVASADDIANLGTNVYVEITDPAAINAITKQQIIKRLFLRNDGTVAAGSISINKVGIKAKEANNKEFISTAINRSDYKVN